MARAMQVVSRPLAHDCAAYAEEWRHWRRPSTVSLLDGISPEQAVHEAIARIKQILSE
jgi:hypothetical protein